MQLYKNIQEQIGTKSLLKSFNHLAMSISSFTCDNMVYMKPTSFYVYSHFTLKQDYKCATSSVVNLMQWFKFP